MHGGLRVAAAATLIGTFVVGVLPVASASAELHEDHVFTSVGDLAVRLEFRFLGEDATRLRRLADHDRDGEVTPTESTTHLTVLRNEHLGVLGDRLRLNAEAPLLVENLTVDVLGLSGMVTSPDPVTFTGAAALTFEVPQALGDHVYVLRPAGVPLSVTVRLPEEATVQASSGLATATVDAARRVVTGVLAEEDALVMFRQATWSDGGPAAGAPGPWPVLVLLCLGLAAAGRRFQGRT